MTQTWGYHYILDCRNVLNYDRPDLMEEFVLSLLRDIGMVPWGKCQLNHFAEKPELAGWTVIQPLTTSTLVMHFLDESKDLYFDLFSCKEFDRAYVRQMVTKYFCPTNIKEAYIERQA